MHNSLVKFGATEHGNVAFHDEWIAAFEEDRVAAAIPNTRHQSGCVSKLDFELYGLNPEDAVGKSGQRATCMCCGNKTELLSHKGRCLHQCLYCFWWD